MWLGLDKPERCFEDWFLEKCGLVLGTLIPINENVDVLDRSLTVSNVWECVC